MRLVRKKCPDPMGRGKHHVHWSFRSKNLRVAWCLWWDYDRKNFGAPIEVMVNTPNKQYLIRPFSKSQRYDWKQGKWSDWKDNGNWRHIVTSPQKPENWGRISADL